MCLWVGILPNAKMYQGRREVVAGVMIAHSLCCKEQLSLQFDSVTVQFKPGFSLLPVSWQAFSGWQQHPGAL